MEEHGSLVVFLNALPGCSHWDYPSSFFIVWRLVWKSNYKRCPKRLLGALMVMGGRDRAVFALLVLCRRRLPHIFLGTLGVLHFLLQDLWSSILCAPFRRIPVILVLEVCCLGVLPRLHCQWGWRVLRVFVTAWTWCRAFLPSLVYSGLGCRALMSLRASKHSSWEMFGRANSAFPSLRFILGFNRDSCFRKVILKKCSV